jgi:signal recognition particle GTPase
LSFESVLKVGSSPQDLNEKKARTESPKSSPTGTTPQSSVVENPEKKTPTKKDQSNPDLWHWHQYGKKNLKNGSHCTYYKCPHSGCSARKLVTLNGSSTTVNLQNEHNHAKPENPKIKKEVAEYVKERLARGDMAVNIEKDLVNRSLLSDAPISAVDIPSKELMRSWKFHIHRKYLPSDESLQNISAMYGKKFVKSASVFPYTKIMCGTDEAFNLLLDHGRYVFIDGTFDVCENKVVMT